ncbi:hypothetical protein SNOUR_41200 [Streptomyces noursei ATCC 11455]|uniref:hypothetical protein n=1 Tax=Streptomyces noursei TaxID=1971 RepID=UPI00081C7506|nr:hypothetical protein SNOUR_41200 [Streptomyces noursei ATCC 11455]
MAARPVLDLRVGVRDLEEVEGAFDEAPAGHGFVRAPTDRTTFPRAVTTIRPAARRS